MEKIIERIAVLITLAILIMIFGLAIWMMLNVWGWIF